MLPHHFPRHGDLRHFVEPLALLCLPVIMIVEYFLALGMAMLSSAVTVYFRDLEHILGIITMVWMYMTPIFYSIDMIPEKLRFVYHINPCPRSSAVIGMCCTTLRCRI